MKEMMLKRRCFKENMLKRRCFTFKELKTLHDTQELLKEDGKEKGCPHVGQLGGVVEKINL